MLTQVSERAPSGLEVGTWNLDLASGRLRCHGLMAELFGVEENGFADLAAREDYRRRIHEDDRARVVASKAETLASGVPYFEILRVTDPAGRLRRVLSHATAVRDASGVPVRFYGLVADLTRTSGSLEAPNPLDLAADSLISALGHARNADDHALTRLIQVCLRHLAENHGETPRSPGLLH